MATFVQLSEDDPAVHLCTLVAALRFGDGDDENQNAAEKIAFVKQSTALVEQQSYYDVLRTVVLGSMTKIMAATKQDINTVYNLSFSFVHTLTIEQASEVIGEFIRELCASDEHALLRLKLLTTLFNLTSTQPYNVFSAILHYALDTNNTALLSGQLGNVDAWTKQWQLTPANEADLYLCLARVATNSDDRQKYMYQYLSVVEKLDAAAVAEAKPYAVQTAVAVIKSPMISDCGGSGDRGILEYAAVNALADDAEDAKLHELLTIVLKAYVIDYTEFHEKSHEIMDKYDIDHEVLLRKMRTLTLCSLACHHQHLPYDDLMGALQAKDDTDVEQFFIDAYTSGHVEGRLAQSERVIYITRYSERCFTDESWNQLGVRLKEWKENVNNVLTLLIRLRQEP